MVMLIDLDLEYQQTQQQQYRQIDMYLELDQTIPPEALLVEMFHLIYDLP